MFKKILNSNIGINFLKKIATILSGLIFLILMTRYLGPQLRGEYAYIMNFVNILATIFNLGISLVLSNFIRNKSDFNFNDFASFSIYQFFLNLLLTISFFIITNNFLYTVIFFLASLSILSLQLNNITLLISVRINSFSFVISSIVNAILIILVYFF